MTMERINLGRLAAAALIVLAAGCTTTRIIDPERLDLIEVRLRPTEGPRDARRLTIVKDPTPGRPALVVELQDGTGVERERQKLFRRVEVREVTRYRPAWDFFLWPLYPLKVAGGLGACAAEVLAPAVVCPGQLGAGAAGLAWGAAYNPVPRGIVFGAVTLGGAVLYYPGYFTVRWARLPFEDAVGPALIDYGAYTVRYFPVFAGFCVANPDLLAAGNPEADQENIWWTILEDPLAVDSWAGWMAGSWNLMWDVEWVPAFYRATLPPTWAWTWRPFSTSHRAVAHVRRETRPLGLVETDWRPAEPEFRARGPAAGTVVTLTAGETQLRAKTDSEGRARFDLGPLVKRVKPDGRLEVRLSAEGADPVEQTYTGARLRPRDD
jgi:hypothetical protein